MVTYLVDFTAYRPPEELKVDMGNTPGIEQWSVRLCGCVWPHLPRCEMAPRARKLTIHPLDLYGAAPQQMYDEDYNSFIRKGAPHGWRRSH